MKYVDWKRDTHYHNVDPLGNPISIKKYHNILPNKDRWTRTIKRMKQSTYLKRIHIKPYPFSRDDKYKSTFASYGIDFALKKKLAPNKPIPSYTAAKLIHKFNTRARLFS